MKKLNELVAQQIFGIQSWDQPSPPLPYAQDISYAKQVLEEMELNNHTYKIFAPDETIEPSPRYNYYTEFSDLGTSVTYGAFGHTLEESICRAAILSRGVTLDDHL